MYQIEREFSIALGHSLSKHQGRCKNPHGHNLLIYIEISSEKLNENNMVMDFGDLKKLGEKFIDPLDHSMLLNVNQTDMIELLQKQNNRIHVFDDDPTAEYLCKYLFDLFRVYLAENYSGVEINRVTIYENDKSNATYSR